MNRQERVFESVSIVLIGKYTSLEDSYMSVVKALEHASMRCGRKLILHVSRSYSGGARLTCSGSTHPTWSRKPSSLTL